MKNPLPERLSMIEDFMYTEPKEWQKKIRTEINYHYSILQEATLPMWSVYQQGHSAHSRAGSAEHQLSQLCRRH